MATQTRTIVTFNGGSCTWTYDYDDVQLRLLAIHCVNDTSFNTRGTVTVNSNGRTFSRLVGPNSTFDQNLPSGAQTRLDITVDARGRVDGIDWSFQWGPGVS